MAKVVNFCTRHRLSKMLKWPPARNALRSLTLVHFFPGMNITALISIGTSVVPAVPTEAIVTYQGQDYIFILSDKEPEHHGGENINKQENGEEHKEEKSLV